MNAPVRAVWPDQHNSYHPGSSLPDHLCASIVVEVCLGEADGDAVDLDPLQAFADSRHKLPYIFIKLQIYTRWINGIDQMLLLILNR